MNTSSIHALAIAAEARSNEAKAELRRVSIASSGLQVATGLPEDDKPSPKADVAAMAASIPPLPALTLTAAAASPASTGTPKPNQERPAAQPASRRKPTFSEKLHAVLANKNLQSIITWLPSGKSFCILDKDRFTRQVLPAYFREAKFESFSRRIKRWGFRKMHTTGLKQVVYTHDLFQKDRLDLCRKMNGRAGQEETSDVVAEAARFENILTEQVALAEKTLGAYHRAASPKMEKARSETNGQKMPMKKRFVPAQSIPVPEAVTRPMPAAGMNYETAPMPMLLPQFQMNQMQQFQQQFQQQQHMQMNHFKMNQINMMGNSHPQGNGMNNNFRAQAINPSMSSSIMYTQGVANRDMARQLNKLDADIAECEEQLLILQRLKALKQRRAMGC